ncbi:MAG TPA: M20/M25/M40 family metallo-hydrolase [Ktedonobacteraceae bacterium]|nr:M20/M25/M40 family metallo-hydrolase [Ktedonobacteraceae bacterium]
MQHSETLEWYSLVKRYTTRLVQVRSVSPGRGEIDVAGEVLCLLREDDLGAVYTTSGLDALEGDSVGRSNAYAFLRGKRPQTIVLLGHIDTVDTADYGALEPFAHDPEGLAARSDALAALVPGLAEDLAARPGDWMFGRGCGDMKSGVAANIAVMRRLASLALKGQLDLSVVFLATPDEENESAGVRQAVRFLSRRRDEYGLDYLGAINTDYTTALYPGDPHRYIYTGSIGKLLPTFFVVGQPSHVGDPFDGLDANLLVAELVRDLSMNAELCDSVRGQQTPPPVTLKATDLKTGYDVQLPFAAYFYLNVLTFSTTPTQLLERLRHYAQAALDRVLRRVDDAEQRWSERLADAAQHTQRRHGSRSGSVLTYAELHHELVKRYGAERLEEELAAAWASMPQGVDSRGRCLHIVRHLWALSGRQGPAVVLYYSPPFIPHVAATDCLLHRSIHALVEAHPELSLVVQEYFPLISDMSYLRLDLGIETETLVANIPTWEPDHPPAHQGSYTLPFQAMRALDLPVVNLGPYGKGAHQAGERVLMSYSFGVLPQLIYEVIEELARNMDQRR